MAKEAKQTDRFSEQTRSCTAEGEPREEIGPDIEDIVHQEDGMA